MKGIHVYKWCQLIIKALDLEIQKFIWIWNVDIHSCCLCMVQDRLATIKRAFGCVDDGEPRSKAKSKVKQSQKQLEKENLPLSERPDYLDSSTMETDSLVLDDVSIMSQTDATG